MTGVARDDSRTSMVTQIAEQYIAPLLGDPRTRRALIAEHRRTPIGRPGRVGRAAFMHSPELTRVLDFFRRAPAEGKYVLLCNPPEAPWQIAALTGRRGEAPRPIEGAVFKAREDAEHAVFERRVDDFLRREAAPPEEGEDA